jgi:WD40 repeat protein
MWNISNKYYNNEKLVKLPIELNQMPELWGYTGHENVINSLYTMFEEKTLITCGSDNRINLWDIESQTFLVSFQQKEIKYQFRSTIKANILKEFNILMSLLNEIKYKKPEYVKAKYIILESNIADVIKEDKIEQIVEKTEKKFYNENTIQKHNIYINFHERGNKNV